MRINNNLSALNTHSRLTAATEAQGKSLQKLSSGLRINRAGDDAAGLAISEKMRGQIKGLNQASRNAQDGISLIQTAEGALNETHSILQRMRELTVQSGNETNSTEDLAAITAEKTQLVAEMDRIGNQTKFNGIDLLNNTNGVDLQIGANTGDTMTITMANMTATGLSVTAASDLTALDTAINDVSTHRADLGATQNRLEHTINNLGTASENLTAAESRIRDVDMAKEMMEFTKNNILTQASTSMLAQANQQPQAVLQLLR
ncbi:flagellin [Acidaminobacter sp.]|uniref:flagellin N-terminal helical domain-containing protein n=1 Tax=Acidaminobacter sp. TaxID=1872102 RepID=UPI00137CE2A9|nr:flagellin [Acidaminobacter sp.]MDK9710595.1 flagellin [Acidaminobacter sp.]MZQ96794.1 flagellin [Acidaminobacter sp.]